MEPLAIALAAALAIVILLLRRPGMFSPALVVEGQDALDALPGDDEEQLPETDRAPRPWLPFCVAAVGAIRLVLLLTLHA
ncbi:MAG: hypothetical protein ACXWLR_14330 [Myxococcales bacterium]